MELQAFEQYVQQKQFDKALDALFQILNAFELGADYSQQYIINKVSPEITGFYTQLAKLLTELFSAASCRPTLTQFYALSIHKNKLNAIFEISEYRHTDHLIAVFLKKLQTAKGMKRAQFVKKYQTTLMKFLLLYNFSNTIEIDFWYYLELDPKLGIETFLGLLAERRIITQAEKKRYDTFITEINKIHSWRLNDHSLPVFGQAWYQAAYDCGDNKFSLLSELNHLIKKWMNKNKFIVSHKETPELNERPKMLVVLEHFRSTHAMYRCFANAIKALKEKFDLIALTEPQDLDPTAAELFDQIITVDLRVPTDLKAAIKAANDLQTDACYFTSVGMKYWCIALANLRLAPIQFVTAGHPISTCSETIDFMLLEDHKFDKKIIFKEKVLGLPSGNFGFVLPRYKKPQVKPKTDNPLKIAIPATAYKLNADYLAVCEEIEKRSQTEIQFCSFSAQQGLAFHRLNQKLRERFDNLILYPALSYDDYLQALSECDLYLAPFPFGGTNSTIDCLLLGVPSVAINMADLACSDSFILRKAGFEKYIANSVEEYCDFALNLIDDEDERLTVKHQMQQLDETLGGLLGDTDSGQAYLNAINYAYHHYEALKQSQEAFFPYE